MPLIISEDEGSGFRALGSAEKTYRGLGPDLWALDVLTVD